jgi:anti-anti-sigma factor
MDGLDFDLSVERDEHGTVRVTARGELDLATAGRLEAALADPGGERFLVDLRGLTFMDSTGVRTLLQATEDAARAGSDLRFVIPPDGDARVALVETGIVAIIPTALPEDGDEDGAR